jgi:hypothetical protein
VWKTTLSPEPERAFNESTKSYLEELTNSSLKKTEIQNANLGKFDSSNLNDRER